MPALLGVARAIIEGIISIFQNINWTEVGEAIVRGIANGIRNGAGWIADAARDAARDALNAAKRLLGIRSPSKVAAEQIGEPFAQGIGRGITNEMSRMGTSLSASMGGMVGNVAAPVAAGGGGSSYNIVVNMGGGGGYSDGRAAGRGIADELRARGLR